MSTAHPRIALGLEEALQLEHGVDSSTDIDAAVRVAGRLWVNASFGSGSTSLYDPAGSGQHDTSLYLGSVGVLRLTCSDLVCWALQGSIGYQRARLEFEGDALGVASHTERRNTVFGQVRMLGGLRLFDCVMLEVALGARLHIPSVDTDDGGIGAGVVGSVGLHILI